MALTGSEAIRTDRIGSPAPERVPQSIERRADLAQDGLLLGDGRLQLVGTLDERAHAGDPAEARLHTRVDGAGVGVNAIGAARAGFDFGLEILEVRSSGGDRSSERVGVVHGSPVRVPRRETEDLQDPHRYSTADQPEIDS